MKVHPEQSAFPLEEDGWVSVPDDYRGLTKREYFAATAIQGLLAHPDSRDLSTLRIANIAVQFADALIDALNRQAAGAGGEE